MSTATASHAGKPATTGATHFLLRRMHSLTGIVFGLYICVHLVVNATLIQGSTHATDPTVFQQQVDKIHSLPFLEVVEWVAIYIPIIFHTVYGIYIVVTGQPNVGTYNYGKNWAYFFQRVSAMILILFIAFHVLAMKGLLMIGGLTFDPANATASTIQHMHYNWIVGYIVYPVGILAACFHLANGFWTAAITWGLTVSAAAQKRWGGVCVLIFLGTFAAGMTAWGAAITQSPTAQQLTTEHVAGDHYKP
ncbi:succinate dehydrogenase cytochrome b558 subunit [soil metagenome]